MAIYNTKHLMTGPKRNSDIWFPRDPQCFLSQTQGASHKVFCYTCTCTSRLKTKFKTDLLNAYEGCAFCIWHYYFLTWPSSGDSDRSASCRTRVTHVLAPNKRHTMFKFSSLICFCQIINRFSWIINAFSSEKLCPTLMVFWHQAA